MKHLGEQMGTAQHRLCGRPNADVADASHRAKVAEEPAQAEPIAPTKQSEVVVQLWDPNSRAVSREPGPELVEQTDQLSQGGIEVFAVQAGRRVHICSMARTVGHR